MKAGFYCKALCCAPMTVRRRITMIKIVFFAPYPQIFQDIRRAFDDRPDRDEFEYEIRQDITNNPLTDLDADIIIAR